jgi:hypothetical protein
MGRTRTERLRGAVDALPPHARVAMLEGLRGETIVAGAYVGTGASVCPMVAVHRRGVRTDANRFARAWDQFCGVAPGESREATERELTTLEAMLQASLLADEYVDLRAAAAAHRDLRRARHAREAVDLAAARTAHQALARERRTREATAVGRSWLRGDAVGAATRAAVRRPAPPAAAPAPVPG